MMNQKTLNTFNELYNTTYPSVLKYVVLNCSNVEDVQDIIQNIYLSLIHCLEKSDIIVDKPYIMGIAKNKVRDYYRFRYKNKIVSIFTNLKNQDNIELIDTVVSDTDIEKNILKKEDINFIWKYLKKKNVTIFKIFYLYYELDYSIKNIANELNISESNVKNHLYRTLKELKMIMKNRSEDNVK